jgi:hypothetical protein
MLGDIIPDSRATSPGIRIWIVERRVAAGGIAQWEKSGKRMATAAICRSVDQIGTKPYQSGPCRQSSACSSGYAKLQALLYDGSLDRVP